MGPSSSSSVDGDRVDGLGVVGVGAPSMLSGGCSQESGQPAGSRVAGSTAGQPNGHGQPSAERGPGGGHSLGSACPSTGSTHRRRTSRELPWLSVVNPGEGLEPTAALPSGSGQHARGPAASMSPEREAALSPGVKLGLGLQQAVGEERYDPLAITYSSLQPLTQLASPSEQQHSLAGSLNWGSPSVGSLHPSPTDGGASARRQLFAEALGPKQKQEQQQPLGGAADWFIKAEGSPGQSGSPTPAADADHWSLSWEVSPAGAGAVIGTVLGSEELSSPKPLQQLMMKLRPLPLGTQSSSEATQQSLVCRSCRAFILSCPRQAALFRRETALFAHVSCIRHMQGAASLSTCSAAARVATAHHVTNQRQHRPLLCRCRP